VNLAIAEVGPSHPNATDHPAWAGDWNYDSLMHIKVLRPLHDFFHVGLCLRIVWGGLPVKGKDGMSGISNHRISLKELFAGIKTAKLVGDLP
jgi:hypothetical protein